MNSSKRLVVLGLGALIVGVFAVPGVEDDVEAFFGSVAVGTSRDGVLTINNPGTANVYRNAGPLAGAITLVITISLFSIR